MPHLEHMLIRLQFHRYSGCDLPENFDNIIAKNPQIQSIELRFSPRIYFEYIESVNSLLPLLKNVTLWKFQSIDREIRFENVSTLSVRSSSSSPSNLHFPKLRNLHIRLHRKRIDEWRDFLNEHSHLTRLHLENFDLNDEDFELLLNEAPNIVELTVCPKGAISTGTITKLLQREHLMRFHLIFKTPHTETIQTELESVENEWNVKIVGEGFSFERKE